MWELLVVTISHETVNYIDVILIELPVVVVAAVVVVVGVVVVVVATVVVVVGVVVVVVDVVIIVLTTVVVVAASHNIKTINRLSLNHGWYTKLFRKSIILYAKNLMFSYLGKK